MKINEDEGGVWQSFTVSENRDPTNFQNYLDTDHLEIEVGSQFQPQGPIIFALTINNYHQFYFSFPFKI